MPKLLEGCEGKRSTYDVKAGAGMTRALRLTARQAWSMKSTASAHGRAVEGMRIAAHSMGLRGSHGPSGSPGRVTLPLIARCSADRGIPEQGCLEKSIRNEFNSS